LADPTFAFCFSFLEIFQNTVFLLMHSILQDIVSQTLLVANGEQQNIEILFPYLFACQHQSTLRLKGWVLKSIDQPLLGEM
jgi:hypothetical protein